MASRFKETFKGMSFMEQKREQERQVDRVLNSKTEDTTVDIQPDDVLSKWLQKKIQCGILFFYGFITLCAIFALIFYLMDMIASTFGGAFDEYMDYILLIIVILTIIGAIMGCCLTFKYGTVSTNIDRLQDATYRIAENVRDFSEIRELLSSEVDVLKSTLKCINTEKNELFQCVDKFDKLSNDLSQNVDSTQNEFAFECNKMCDDLFAEYEYIKFQNEKADLLKLFYDKQGFDDNVDGLSRTEFEYLLFDLDDNIRDRFPDFEVFDRNDDGIVDIFEFDAVLEDIYKNIYQDINKNVDRKIGDHYINRNKQNQNINDQRKERREAIEREKQKKMPLSMFKLLR